ncbi:MAG TPA: DUF72 domain-containing protein [Alphaproteobacteria bacterium]|nr:DUF72 domain-containing protein [Alphaproteobacteria bacterium]
MARSGKIRIGVSGWTYAGWRGTFYPRGLPRQRELGYAAAHFTAVEINGTFYGLQRPAAFRAWAAEVPDDFVFAVKGSRYITHMLKLKGIEAALANFLASGPLALGEKLGPILWQFPPMLRFDPERFEAIFRMLPHDTLAVARLAARHDHRLRASPCLDPWPVRPVRHAVEIRHESFRDAAFVALLRRHGIALVAADSVDWPLLMDLTADFVYCRLHGSVELYNSAYSEAELDRWAGRIRAWSAGKPMTDGEFVTAPVRDRRRRDVFLFFDNTDKLMAPNNAKGLMRRLGIVTEEQDRGQNQDRHRRVGVRGLAGRRVLP